MVGRGPLNNQHDSFLQRYIQHCSRKKFAPCPTHYAERLRLAYVIHKNLIRKCWPFVPERNCRIVTRSFPWCFCSIHEVEHIKRTNTCSIKIKGSLLLPTRIFAVFCSVYCISVRFYITKCLTYSKFIRKKKRMRFVTNFSRHSEIDSPQFSYVQQQFSFQAGFPFQFQVTPWNISIFY